MEMKKVHLIMNKMLLMKKDSLCIYGNDLIESLMILESHNKLILNTPSEMIFRLKVQNSFCNLFGTMHGGAIASLVDVSTTLLVSAFDKTSRHNVSVELNTQYLNPINNNSSILIHCKVPKSGKSLAYSYADIYDEETLKIAAKASHIKAFLDKKWDI